MSRQTVQMTSLFPANRRWDEQQGIQAPRGPHHVHSCAHGEEHTIFGEGCLTYTLVHLQSCRMSVGSIMAESAQSLRQVALVGGRGDAPQVEKTGLAVSEAALHDFNNFVEVCVANVGNKSDGVENRSQLRRSARFASSPPRPEPCPRSLPTPLEQQVRGAVSSAGWAEFRVWCPLHGHRWHLGPRPWAPLSSNIARAAGHPCPASPC